MTQSETTSAAGGPLWCMHIQGPDDLHAAPDFWTALAWAAELNSFIAEKAAKGNWKADENYPLSQAVVRQWTGTPESHAVQCEIELADRAEHEAKRKAAALAAPTAKGGTEVPAGLAQSHYELLRECQAEFRALGCKGLVETIETALGRSGHLVPASLATGGDGGRGAGAPVSPNHSVVANSEYRYQEPDNRAYSIANPATATPQVDPRKEALAVLEEIPRWSTPEEFVRAFRHLGRAAEADRIEAALVTLRPEERDGEVRP